MNLRGRIRLKERQMDLAQRSLTQSTQEFRRVLHARLSSRTALAAGFAGGLLLGWQQRRRQHAKRARRSRGADGGDSGVRRATRGATQGMPPHWLRSYIVWPFLLATARDAVVNRRPTRGQP